MVLLLLVDDSINDWGPLEIGGESEVNLLLHECKNCFSVAFDLVLINGCCCYLLGGVELQCSEVI